MLKTLFMHNPANMLKTVSLDNYASNNIADYQTVTSVPQTNIDYLNSGLAVISAQNAFKDCKNLTSFSGINFDMSKCTKAVSMFEECRSLISLDVSNWNTSNVIDMWNTFRNCQALTFLDVSNWNTSNVTRMIFMFDSCKAITSLNVSNWDTSNVIDMYAMFQYCSSLTSLDISNWNTSNVTDMGLMFFTCSSLTSIVGAIDMSSCTNCKYMFMRCNKLKGVHLKNVPKSLDMSEIGGTEGVTYIIDNYI